MLKTTKMPARKPTRSRKPTAADDDFGAGSWALTKNQRKTMRKTVGLIALVVVAVMLVWGVQALRTELQFRRDKKQYAATEVSMQKVYDQMVAAAGQPVEEHTVKSCGHKSAKLEGGDLVCQVEYSFFYSISYASQGSGSKNMILIVLNKFASPPNMISEATISSQPVTFSQDYTFKNSDALGCGLEYKIVNKDQHNNNVDNKYGTDAFNVKISTDYAATYSFICGGGAAKPIYKVSD